MRVRMLKFEGDRTERQRESTDRESMRERILKFEGDRTERERERSR